MLSFIFVQQNIFKDLKLIIMKLLSEVSIEIKVFGV